MTLEQERRNPSTERVKVATLVEVCGNIPGIPVFEAESVNVSPQGMQLRTAYLPDAGSPLVCRFESDGREIVVEGMVAWRKESGRGGEFGVKFTALDSRSVDALRTLCGIDDAPKAGKSDSLVGEPGARVRLHIEGLGSPMKARVKTGGSAKVQVGSSLEFLKVGKRLELEDLEVGGRRAAEIDTVSVVVDPSTRVPQLVVGLLFEGADEESPAPSVANLGPGEAGTVGVRIPTRQVSTDAAPRRASAEATPDEPKPAAGKARAESKVSAQASQEDRDEDDDEPEMRGRVATIAASAEQRAKVAGEKLSRASASAAHGALLWMKGASDRLLTRKARPPARRTTSPAPSLHSAEKPKLRQQSGSSASAGEASVDRNHRRTIAIAASVSLVAIGTLALVLRGPSAPPPGAKLADGTTDVGNPDAVMAAVPEALPKLKGSAPSAPGSAVVANVPLFGPTPLTTTEPAPLGPPPGSDAASIEASERAEAKASLAPRAMDEAFPGSEDEGPSRSRDDKKNEPKPEDVSPWGHGRMHEPTIHRMRLDAAGAKIAGNMEPTGFTVIIPDRKVMETGAAITKRDPRIARVRATNTASGAQVSFRFKDGVPSYRVRLRRDYVEFLISEAGKEASSEAKSASKADAKKRSAAQ